MQLGLHDFTNCTCLQLGMNPARTCEHSSAVMFGISCPKSCSLHFLNSPLGIERIHLQELSRAEAHQFMQSELFAQRLNLLLPILKLHFCCFSAARRVSAGCRLLYLSSLPVSPCPCVCCLAAFSLLRYLIFNNKKVLFQFQVTAASSSRSVISPDLLTLLILIRLTLALFEAESLMSPLIRKWHPL